ncbi:MAG: hypothetical protein Q7W02_05935 [Candidatus Rokubacteria bacterium]|nr:hypothetical protein [Candidatus Rokubacteria bacterium]
MPYLFRSINKRRWDWGAGDPSWLPPGAVPAAPLGDLAPTPSSALSLWWIADDKSNVGRVVAALAAGRQHLDKYDYALIEEGAVRGLGIKVESAPETCPDQDASNRWHHNLLELTADKIFALVGLIKSTSELDRLLAPDVERLLKEGLESGFLDESKVHSKLRERLQPPKKE